MTLRRRIAGASGALLLALCAGCALAAVPVHRIDTDLRPLIRAASHSRVQFAVLVPLTASTASSGSWSSTTGQARWSYAVEVPTAVSLSFHATPVVLPPSATLIVRGARTTTSYRAADVHRGELWSRVQPGAALQFTLSVAAAERSQVRLGLVSLQAGYRSLGAGVEDHPYYRALLQARAGAASNTTCITNYECKITAANTPAGAATVALLVQNQFQCSGTLINDVPGDNTPYLLTARHCITGKVGVSDEPVAAAAGTTVYWDATRACGAALGSIYDPNIPVQSGATTMVEQEDAWLIRLDVNPVVPDAQFAGFDASGAALTGGYTIHHAEGGDKQFVAWFGTPAKTVQFTGFAAFLETVNQTGNVGPGASGSALYDQNNRLVGSLTYGRDTSDPSGYQSCPLPTPPAPDGLNGVADFSALATLWNLASDSTSATGAATLKSVLDPAGTGTLVTPSAPAAAITFDASVAAQVYGQPLLLSWSASGASECSASGGIAGDGWSGSFAASGHLSLTENAASAATTYTLTCAYAGARTANASVNVTWEGPAPQLTLTATPTAAWTTRPVTLTWSANVTPCALAGGSLALTNLPGSGTTTSTSASSADVTYTLSCGPANNRGVVAVLVQYTTPSVILEADGTDRRLGENFMLQWQSFADMCTALGGAPADGWAGNSFVGGPSVGSFVPVVSAAGTYTYTLSCSAGTLIEQQSVTVTFENNAPYVTAALSAGSVAFSDSPADYATLTWNSNLSSCTSSSSPASLNTMTDDPLGAVSQPQGALTLSPQQSGQYVLRVTCNSWNSPASVVSLPVSFTVTAPAAPGVSLSVNPATVAAGQTFTLAWTSTGSAGCSRNGGMPGDGWPGPAAPAGSVTEVAAAGSFVFDISCDSIDPATASAEAQLPLLVGTLSAALASNTRTVTRGGSFTLSWSSVAATFCSASGGGANGTPWSGALATSGSVTQTASTSGSFDYELTCGNGSLKVSQDLTITVTAAAASSDSSGGGGGELGIPELAALGMLLGRRRVRSLVPRH